MAEDWGIPTLDASRQMRSIVPPILPYGVRARGERTGGTIHFYVDDAKFTRLFARPDRILETGCVAAIEPNCSTGPDVPRALALAGVCRKRTVAACWQARGLDICVDLNVDDACLDLALLGVPDGWRSYATRTHRRDTLADAEHRYRIAIGHAGTRDILFVVVGGGVRIRSECRQRGWTYVPEQCRVARGEEAPYG